MLTDDGKKEYIERLENEYIQVIAAVEKAYELWKMIKTQPHYELKNISVRAGKIHHALYSRKLYLETALEQVKR